MASRRIAKSNINWSALAERVPPNQKASFNAFKSKSDKIVRTVMANPETAPKIDWAFYKGRVATAGLVDNFQKQYESITIPYPPDNVTSKIDAQAKQVRGEIDSYVSNSKSRISGFEKEIAHLTSLLPFDQMTMEDYRDSFPEEALDPINKPTYWPHTEDENTERKHEEGHH